LDIIEHDGLGPLCYRVGQSGKLPEPDEREASAGRGGYPDAVDGRDYGA
jgi:hypothetical protein